MANFGDLGQPAKNIARFVFIVIIVAIFYTLFIVSKDFLVSNDFISPQRDEKKVFVDSLKFNYKIVKIVDGDTLEVKRLDGKDIDGLGKIVKVRLIGINSPESVDPRRPVECFGVEAGEYLKKISLGRIAALEFDESQAKIDEYGRILAYVFIKNSGVYPNNISLLNEEMIKNGYAYEYTYSTPYKYQNEFKYFQELARRDYLGLWSTLTCDGLKTPVSPPPKN